MLYLFTKLSQCLLFPNQICFHISFCPPHLFWASLVAQRLKRLPPMWETQVRSLGRDNPLEKEMATHSSILAWRIPWTEELGRLQSTGSQRVEHDWVTSLSLSSRLRNGWDCLKDLNVKENFNIEHNLYFISYAFSSFLSHLFSRSWLQQSLVLTTTTTQSHLPVLEYKNKKHSNRKTNLFSF